MESSTIQKPDILTVLVKEGIELQQRGRHFWACCPLHSERTASFCVNPEKQKWKCFGCGASGDSIDFIMKLKGISFRDALGYMGIPGNGQGKPDPLEFKKRKLVRQFNRWVQLYRRAVCELLRLAKRIDLAIKTPEDLELLGISEMYLRKFIHEYHLSILNGNDNQAKFELYKEVVYGND